MDLATLSVKRPIFITCLVILMLALGVLAIKKIPVDLFPNVTFPVVMVNTPYPGAGSGEIETQISKVLEDELSSLSGIKRIRSTSQAGLSTVVVEFALETDIKDAEQHVRDRVTAVRNKFPMEAKASVIRRLDPADQPILVLALNADLPEGALFDLADERIKPRLEQVNHVGLVDLRGGRKREILVELDRNQLKARELSATRVSNAIAASGQNVPIGKIKGQEKETVLRTLGDYKHLSDVGSAIVNFLGNDVPVRVSDLGTVKDTLADETGRAFVNGKKAIFLNIYRQSGSNTIAVADALKKRLAVINSQIKDSPGHPSLTVVRDGSLRISANVLDVKESILFGIVLTIIVVYLFLGSVRSTVITGLALPNSLLGAFVLMSLFGFSINIMTLLALSLSVGLLIDDAIVVRENIFRHLEMGKTPIQAALEGTKEVTLAVVATTFSVLAVFGPIAFLHGIVGQFFKEFGLTVCFVMIISLFDALTIAPMLSAYFAGRSTDKSGFLSVFLESTIGLFPKYFGKFQVALERGYEHVLRFTLRHRVVVILIAIGIFVVSIQVMKHVPKTFLPAQDFGEFVVSLEMPPGTSLSAMHVIAKKVDYQLHTNKEVVNTVLTVGGDAGQANVASMYVTLVSSKQRKMNTSQFKDRVREQMKLFAYAQPVVKESDISGGGDRQFNLVIIGHDFKELDRISMIVLARLKKHPALSDVETSYKPGKPEIQVRFSDEQVGRLGVSKLMAGQELRTQIEGALPAVFRDGGVEYDIRVRLRDDQRNLKRDFSETYIPNINQSLIHVADVASAVEAEGPANITRQDRGRYIQISADVAPKGPGLGGAVSDIKKMFQTDIKLPEGMSYDFLGQAENFKELGQNMAIAALLGVLFIYLVLASLYESFITPITIMLVLPLAACGAFYALFITGESLNIFSMIGCVMLLGISTKNSILLVDYTRQLVKTGMSETDALIQAGKVRLRPILMTTFALIAGTLPIALGLNEASKQRVSLGVVVIGGLFSSTLLTLVVVPAAYGYIERLREWLLRFRPNR
ncbi:MAG: efflux RND transporter permease subunit [Candidatus Margulisbacteria bacterium]|nr:efflux RND transporter permease subunit [Candidatus Margulisiibacteriota bacterium]